MAADGGGLAALGDSDATVPRIEPMGETASEVSTLGPSALAPWRRAADKVVPTMAAGSTLVLCLHQLLSPPVVVLANNGDFDRLLGVIGLRTTGPGYATPYGWLHFTTGHTASHGLYVTSYLGVTGLASLAAHTVLGGSFDVRILGAVLSLLLSGLVYVLVRSLDGWVVRVVSGVILVLGIADSRLVAYFNSWYDEPWTLLILLALVVWLVRNRGKRALGSRQIAILVVIAALLVTAKTQNAVLAFPLAALVCVVTRDRSRQGRLLSLRRSSLWASIVLGFAVVYVAVQSPVYASESQYNLIFSDLLLHVPDPAATLGSLGLPPAMDEYRASNAYWPPNGYHSKAFRDFEHGDASERLAKYFITHPATAAAALMRGTKLGWHADLNYLGYRTQAKGVPPRSDACEPCLYSQSTAEISGSGPWLTLGLYVAGLMTAYSARRRGIGGVADALVVLTAVSAVALAAAVFGEGTYEEVKHLYLFYVANLLLLTLTLAVNLGIVSRGLARIRRTLPSLGGELL